MRGEHVQRTRGIGTLRYVLAWSVIGVVTAAILGTVLVPRIAGATPYVILTGSMKPEFPPGTMVVTRPVAAADVQLGNVITYQLVSGEPTVVTHRVVAQGFSTTGEAVFRTRGDANNTVDPAWVRPVQIRGESWYAVPYLGYLTNQLDRMDRVLVQRTLAAGLLGYAALMVLLGIRDRRPAAAS